MRKARYTMPGSLPWSRQVLRAKRLKGPKSFAGDEDEAESTGMRAGGRVPGGLGGLGTGLTRAEKRRALPRSQPEGGAPGPPGRRASRRLLQQRRPRFDAGRVRAAGRVAPGDPRRVAASPWAARRKGRGAAGGGRRRA